MFSNDRRYIIVTLANNYRFEVVHVGDQYKKPFHATAYGDPLGRNGITAYGTTPWDAISNAAIGAANYEYSLIKREAKRATVSAPIKTKKEKHK